MLLAIVLAAFAVPGMASACHDAAPTRVVAHHGAHHSGGKPDKIAVAHACIGCIPPSSFAARGFVAPAPRAVLPLRIVASAFDRGLSAPPALPPPRLG